MRISPWGGIFGVLLLTVASCGDSAADLGGAEVEFLSGMITHHQQAVQMADMALTNTERPELLDMAEEIIATQTAEIDEMTSLLEAAGEPVPTTMTGMDQDDMNMGGMMSAEEMSQMEAMSDNEFDLVFLEMMTEHHQGAIEASNQVLATDPGPEVTELAEAIVAAQQAEIEQMAAWSEAWR